MSTKKVNTYYPVQVWLFSGGLIGPILLTVCQYFFQRDFVFDAEDLFWYMVLGLVVSTPLLGICYQIHSMMVLKEVKALKIRILLNAISITGLVIITRLYVGYDYMIIGCYSLAIIITSFLFKVYRNKTEITI